MRYEKGEGNFGRIKVWTESKRMVRQVVWTCEEEGAYVGKRMLKTGPQEGGREADIRGHL